MFQADLLGMKIDLLDNNKYISTEEKDTTDAVWETATDAWCCIASAFSQNVYGEYVQENLAPCRSSGNIRSCSIPVLCFAFRQKRHSVNSVIFRFVFALFPTTLGGFSALSRARRIRAVPPGQLKNSHAFSLLP